MPADKPSIERDGASPPRRAPLRDCGSEIVATRKAPFSDGKGAARACLPGPGRRSLAAVRLNDFHRMDPHLLVGLVNTELRNQADSLEDLAKTHGIDQARLVERLATAGYDYLPEAGQFR